MMVAAVPALALMDNGDAPLGSSDGVYYMKYGMDGYGRGELPYEAIWYDQPYTVKSNGEIPTAWKIWATTPDGETVPSFCTEFDSGMFGWDGYVVDETNRGLDAETIAFLIAALDYSFDTYGLEENTDWWFDKTIDNLGKFLAQFIVWIVVEGGNLSYIDGVGEWELFAEPLADVFANCEAYYAAKMQEGTTYVSGLIFLEGKDRPWADQKQVIPIFDEFIDYKWGDTGSLTISKALGEKVSYKGSITGGYSEEAVPDAKGKYDHALYTHSLVKALGEKGNWFQYNEFDGGYGSFDLVQGDKLNYMGGYSIVANGDGSFTLTLDDLVSAIGGKLSISNTILAAKNKNDKNFNANNIWTTAPGQQQFSFSGNSFTFYAPWVDADKTVYVYLHLDGIEGYKNTFGAPSGSTFEFFVAPVDGIGFFVDVPMNGSLTLTGLAVGEYYIVEVTEGWKAAFTVNGVAAEGSPATFTIVKDKTTVIKAVNEPDDGTGDPNGGWLSVILNMEEEYFEETYRPIYEPIYKPIYRPVYEPVYTDILEPIYGKETVKDTLVSRIGDDLLSLIEYDAVVGGAYLKNGFTYLAVDVEALRGLENGVDIGIALSNMPNGKAWNTPVGPTFYNMKIVGNELVVTCAFNNSFGVLVSDVPWDLDYNANRDIKHNGVTNYALPAEDIIYVFFHAESVSWTNDKIVGWEKVGEEFAGYVLVGWEKAGEKLVGWKLVDWELVDTIGPLYRDFEGDVTLEITDAEGTVIFEGLFEPDLGGLFMAAEIEFGTYTVSVFVDGALVAEMTQNVNTYDTMTFDFGNLFVNLGFVERINL